MTGKKNIQKAKGGSADDALKPSDAKKAPSQADNQFVSEKTVRFAVLGGVIIVVGYFAYPFAEDWFVSNFFEEREPIRTAETAEESPPEKSSEVLEETQPETVLNAPEVLDETPLEGGEEPAGEPIEGIQASTLTQENETTAEPAEEIASDSPPTETLPPAFDETRVANLEAELNSLKEELAERATTPDASTAHFASAVAGLAAPLYQSRSFVGELEEVRILILGMAALDQATLAGPMGLLSDFSRTGVPDSAALEAAFKDASLQALRDEGLTETSGWWVRTWAQIKGLVVVRRTDVADSATLEGAIVRMENSLGVGDIRTSLEILETLNAIDAAAFENWAKLAEGRAGALEAFEKLINFIPKQKSGDN